MPLRPVSELGLVDVTDLGSRDEDGTEPPPSTTRSARSSARAASSGPSKRPRARAASSGPSKRPGAPPPRKPASARADRPAVRKAVTRPSSSGGTPAPASAITPTGTPRSAAKDAGLSLLGGAIGVTAALLLGRRMLQR